MTGTKVFLDTNILVFAYDTTVPHKQRIAQKILVSGLQEETAVLSAQVLGEFFVVVTRKIKTPMTADEAGEIINVLSVLPVIEIDLALVERAVDLHRDHRISYWGALIVAAAQRGGCNHIYTEDLNDGQGFDGVVVKNPF